MKFHAYTLTLTLTAPFSPQWQCNWQSSTHSFIPISHNTYTRMHSPVSPPPPSPAPPPLSLFSCSPSDTLSIIYIPTTCQTRKWQALLAPQDRPTQGHRVCEDTKKTHKPSDVESSARGTGDSADGRTSSMTAGSWGGETELNCQKRDALPHTRSVLEREQLWMREQLSYPSTNPMASPMGTVRQNEQGQGWAWSDGTAERHHKYVS